MSRRWIGRFLEAHAAELDAAFNTQLAYGRDLKDFHDWLERKGRGFDTASRADIEAYLVHCDAQGLAAATRARRLASIRQLYRFAFEEGLRADNPAIRLKGPGKPKTLPKSLTEAEVTGLLDAARRYGSGNVYLVRPDGHIAAVFREPNIGAVTPHVALTPLALPGPRADADEIVALLREAAQ